MKKLLNNKSKKSFFLLLGIICLIMLNGLYRKDQLKKHSIYTVCKVYDIKKTGRGARTLDGTSAYFNYIVDGQLFSSYMRHYPHIKIGKCYEMIYSSTNPKNIKVYFDKEVDCSNYKERVY